jgi:glucose-6-phosphate 1-dehydrogenase
VLDAAPVGQSIRFTRPAAVEERWRVMQPLLDAPPPVHLDELLAGHGRWQGPWIAA